MVTNVELGKEVDEKKGKNRLLGEALEEMKIRLEVVVDVAKGKEGEINDRGNEIAKEDVVLERDPILNEEPFLKATKAIGGKALKEELD